MEVFTMSLDMKSIISNQGMQLSFNELVEIAMKLPEKQKIKLATILVDADEEMSKAELIAKIRESVREVKLYKEGKLELRTLNDFLADV